MLIFSSHQGRGTSDRTESQQYFGDLGTHKKNFIWVGGDDGDAIELASSKKKIEARKNWLRHFEVSSTIFTDSTR